MKLSHVLVLVTFLGILAMATHVSIDSDTWWHLRAGQTMVESGKLITQDEFSYTSYGKAWQYPGLWVQVFMYKLYDWFGAGGLNLWVSLTITGIFVIVWQTTSGNVLLRSGVILLAAISSAIYWAARPYLVTYLIFALFFLLLERFRIYGKKTLWVLPILMVVWVNSHGGFLAGFLIFLPYLAEFMIEWLAAKRTSDQKQTEFAKDQFIYILVIFMATLAASFVSPQGFELWKLPFSTVSRQAEQLFIAEWQSPNFHDGYLLPFAFLIFLALAALGGSGKRARLSEILLLSGFGLLGLISVRNIFFFAIIAPAALTTYGGAALEGIARDLDFKGTIDFSKESNRTGKILNVVLSLIVGIICVLRIVIYIPSEANQIEFNEKYPVAAAEFLQDARLPGRMFNTYNQGGYFIWALPEYPVFVDGRADLHQDEVILTWYRVVNGSDEWREVFDRWGIGFAVLEPQMPLISILEDAGWQEIYRDDLVVIVLWPSQSTE